jgi:putative membrane protein
MSAVFAFLHHLAAFGLGSALAVEHVLLQNELTSDSARKLRLADLIFGACAGAVLVLGGLRVFYFEKGTDYYFHSAPFIAKFSLFVIVGLISIYPTAEILSWKRSLNRQETPLLSESKRRAMLTAIRFEFAGIALLILCAALMARGVGSFG